MAKHVSNNHSFDEYKSRFENCENLRSYSDQEVNDYLKLNKNKKSLLDHHKWWHINGVYYQIPDKNGTNKLLVTLFSIIGIGGVASALILPIVLNSQGGGSTTGTTTEPGPGPEPVETTYTVDFNTNGGSAIESQKVKEGECATKPEDGATTKDGYYLVNWMKDGEVFDFATPIVSNITLAAEWTELLYNVNFIGENSSVFLSQKVPYNTTVLPPEENPQSSEENTTFAGWYSTSECAEVFDFNTKITSDLNIYAKFEKSYTVNFFAAAGTLAKTVKVPQGDLVDELRSSDISDVTADYSDCELVGWYTDETCENPYDFTKEVTSNLNLYAKWKINAQDFHISGSHNIDCDTGETLTLISNDEYHLDEELSSNNAYIETFDSNLFSPIGLTLKLNDGVYVGSDDITVSKTFVSPSEAVTMSKTFEVEIGSYNKLDLESLEDGIAKAKDSSISGAVYIPKRYYSEQKGKWVNIHKIADGAFEGNENIESVYISIPTIEIGANAFAGCNGLTSIQFEDQSNTWEFGGKELSPADTEDLKEILTNLKDGSSTSKVPTKTGLTFVLSEDGKYYEVAQDSTKSKEVPANLLIPSYVYWDKDKEVWVTTYKEGESLPVQGFYYNGTGAFVGNANIETVTIHSKSNLTSIGQSAFEGCENLKGIYFLEKENDVYIRGIEDYAFAKTTKLTSIELPNKIEYIGEGAFINSAIESIVIPSSVKDTSDNLGIESNAFNSCTSLNSVIINSKNISAILTGTFVNCQKLEQFTVPYCIKTIMGKSFADSNLKSVTFTDSMSTWKEYEATESYMEASGNTAEAKAKNAELLKQVGETVYKHNEYTDFDFELYDKNNPSTGYKLVGYHGKDTTVTIPSYCYYLENDAYFPVIAIADNVFNSAANNNVDTSTISKIVVPNTVKEIGKAAFKNMPVLNSITFPINDNFTTLSEELFMNCPKLSKLTIPSSINKIGKNAFKYGTSNAAYAYNYGVTNVTFAISLIDWDVNGATVRTTNDSPRDNAKLLKNTYVDYEWNKQKSSEDVLQSVYYTVLKQTYALNECFSANEISINMYNTVTGKSKNISLDDNVKYYEFGGFEKKEWFGPSGEKPVFKDITEEVKNGTYTSSEVITKRLKIEIEIDGEIWTNFSLNKSYYGLFMVDFVKATEESNFEFTPVDENDLTKGVSIRAKTDAKFEQTVVIPSEVTYKEQKVKVTAIESIGFANLATVTYISLPSTIELIDKGAFSGSSDLQYVEIAYGVETIESEIIADTSVQYLTIPSSTKNMRLGTLPKTLKAIYFQDYTKTWKTDSGLIFNPCTKSDDEILNFIKSSCYETFYAQ